MDLTALELGLRNRQLLQVKCFLKIQVETFRYFLSEELPRLKTADERVASLDKFFTHDWQNVINKIVSVAVVNMTGDYGSMMLAVSLFRGLIQSCNQLLLIIASIKRGDLVTDGLQQQSSETTSETTTSAGPFSGRPLHPVFSRVSSSSSSVDLISSTSSSSLSDSSNSIKEKIFTVLQRQIRSIKSHLERVYQVNVGISEEVDVDEADDSLSMTTASHKSSARGRERRQSSSTNFSTTHTILSNSLVLSGNDHHHEQQQQQQQQQLTITAEQLAAAPEATFRAALETTTDKIGLLQCLAKRHLTEKTDFHQWSTVVETIVDLVSRRLKSATEMTAALEEQTFTALSQTGLPCLYLLYRLLKQTTDGVLRQKILQLLFYRRFTSVPALQAAIEAELASVRAQAQQQLSSLKIGENIEKKVDLPRYLKILSIIDLYAFCYRPKLAESETVEASIGWVLSSSDPQQALVKSFLLPALEEISAHPDLFTNWRSLNESLLYPPPLWRLLDGDEGGYFLRATDFAELVTAEVLWQYAVDRSRLQLAVDWIETGHASLPYCPAIAVPEGQLATAQRMLAYLHTHGSFLLKQRVMGALLCGRGRQTFFGGFTFYQLNPGSFTFQTMLGTVGQSGRLLLNSSAASISSSSQHLHLLSCFLPLSETDGEEENDQPSISSSPHLQPDLRLQLSRLVDYCLANGLYEFLYLLYGRFRAQLAPIIAQELRVKLENGSAQKSKVLRLLVHFDEHSSAEATDDKSWDFVFAKTLPTIEYLYGGGGSEGEDKDHLSTIVRHLLIKEEDKDSFPQQQPADIDLALLTLSFSSELTLDRLAQRLRSSHVLTSSSFSKLLHYKYPLIWRAFEPALNDDSKDGATTEERGSTQNLASRTSAEMTKIVNLASGQSTSVDLYFLLQQAVPYINIDKFFRWQVRRRRRGSFRQNSGSSNNSSSGQQTNRQKEDNDEEEEEGDNGTADSYDEDVESVATTSSGRPQRRHRRKRASSKSADVGGGGGGHYSSNNNNNNNNHHSNSEMPTFSANRLSELYGLKAELTSSYYLKNGRLLQAFFRCFNGFRGFGNKWSASAAGRGDAIGMGISSATSSSFRELQNQHQQQSLNPKFVIKLVIKTSRKAAQIAYSSLRSDAVFTCSLLFQALVRVNLLAPPPSPPTTGSSSGRKKSASESHHHSRRHRHAGTPTTSASSAQQQQGENSNYQQATLIDDAEFEKSRLHLALGRLIAEHAADAVSVQSSAQQQQSMLGSLLRKSHFKGDRASSQKLLDLAVIAMERKYAQAAAAQAAAAVSGGGSKKKGKPVLLTQRLHSLLLKPAEVEKSAGAEQQVPPPTSSSLSRAFSRQSSSGEDMSKSEPSTIARKLLRRSSSSQPPPSTPPPTAQPSKSGSLFEEEEEEGECPLLLLEAFDWKPLFAFADLFSLKRPLSFLGKCAREDDWLVFAIFAQMYALSKDAVQAFLRNGGSGGSGQPFNNPCIGEHLAKAFQSSARLLNSASVNASSMMSAADSKLVRLKQPAASSRNDLYSRLFKGRVAANNSNNSSGNYLESSPLSQQSTSFEGPRTGGGDDQEGSVALTLEQQLDLLSTSANSTSPDNNPDHSTSAFSVMSRLSDDSLAAGAGGSRHLPLIIYEQALKPETANRDFLQLVLEIYQAVQGFAVRANLSSQAAEAALRNTLLYAAVSLSNPVLALLTSSLERPPSMTPFISIVGSGGGGGRSPNSTSSPINQQHNEHSRASFGSVQSVELSAGSANSRFKFTAFMCWLLSSVSLSSKQIFIDSYLYARGGTGGTGNAEKGSEENGTEESDSSHQNKGGGSFFVPTAAANISATSFLSSASNSPVLIGCYLDWSAERSLHLLDMLTSQQQPDDAKVFRLLAEALAIFGVDIPILDSLLTFLVAFFLEKDYYPEEALLQQFKTRLQAYNEEEYMLSKGVVPPSMEGSYEASFETTVHDEDQFVSDQGSLRIFYSKSWIEKCALILVTNSLLIARQFELGILLSHYSFVRLQESFTSNYLRIPDIRNLYFFSQCLAKLPNFSLPIAELLRHGPTFRSNEDNGEACGEADYTEYVSIFRKLILDLQEAGHFDEARNILNLLPKANLNEFLINEWMLKAKKANSGGGGGKKPTNTEEGAENEELSEMGVTNANTITNTISNNSSTTTLDTIDLSFWENCWTAVTKIDPTMHSAFKVMERFVEHLEPNQLLIKCFVLLKCMIAIESILRDFIETNSAEEEVKTSAGAADSPNDSSNNGQTTQPMTTFFDDLATKDTLDLVEDYFTFEYALWTSAVECEYLILHSSSSPEQQNLNSSSFDDTIVAAWRQIWCDIVHYIKGSAFGSRILPKLSLKYTFLYKKSSMMMGGSKGGSKQNNGKKNGTNSSSSSSPMSEGPRQAALNQVIGKLLDALCLAKAKEVAAIFRYTHDDFEIIEACDSAAKGPVQSVSDASFAIQFKIQNLSAEEAARLANASSLFPSQNLSTDQRQTISLIATFSHFATIGAKSCQLILLYYKIACILRLPYIELMQPGSAFSCPVKVFELLLSSNQEQSGAAASAGSFSATGTSRDRTTSFESSFDGGGGGASVLDSSAGNDHDQNRNSLDTKSAGQHSSALLNQYAEAIGCAKELVRIVGEQDERLKSEAKVAALLAAHTQANVLALVERQFRDLSSDGTSGSPNPATIKAVTEIELDKGQLGFYSARFLVLLKLLRAPATLGHSLLEACKKEKAAFEEQTGVYGGGSSSPSSPSSSSPELEYALAKRKHYVLLVELYIRAHECFTAQCDVHGIALVLRRTRLLITSELQAERYFHLILRLLTGIGRYSEMTYCFDLFRDCDRFELILSKRVQRTPQLRIALLNYLKTTNKALEELLPLVAIRFFLFRETADYHRARAERLLAEIVLREMGTNAPGGGNNAANSSSTFASSNLTQSHSSAKFSALLAAASAVTPSTTPTHTAVSAARPVVNRVSLNSLADYHHSGSPSSTPTSSSFFQSMMMGGGSAAAAAAAAANTSTLRDPATRQQLERLMYEYQEAEANYTKASSHTNADHCGRRAQLVALQIALISRASSGSTLPDPVTTASGLTLTAISASSSSNTTSIPFIINLEGGQVREFINQCPSFFEALIVARAYPEANVSDWTDALFSNVVLGGSTAYLADYTATFPLTMATLKSLLKRLDQLTTAFRLAAQRQSRASLLTARDLGGNGRGGGENGQQASPSSASFNYLLGLVRDDRDLGKARRMLEPLLERLLCGSVSTIGSSDPLTSILATLPPLTATVSGSGSSNNYSLKERYKLAAAFKSPRLLQRLLDADQENAAYLLDLKATTKKL